MANLFTTKNTNQLLSKINGDSKLLKQFKLILKNLQPELLEQLNNPKEFIQLANLESINKAIQDNDLLYLTLATLDKQIIPKILFILKYVGDKYNLPAYVVGGYVRDEILKKENKDIDVVVEKKDGGRIFAKKLVDIGIANKFVEYPNFGTAMVNIDGMEVEFVHSRKEKYHRESRKPETSFGTLQDDSKRRDFTFNALYKGSDGKIKDPTGKGIDDLNNKIIRTTSDPNDIFSEDPLRMLRAIHFAVKYNFKMADDILPAIKSNKKRLAIISMERIRDEFIKIILTNNAKQGLDLLYKTGLAEHFLPQLKNYNSIANLESNIHIRLAYLLKDSPNVDFLKKLRLSTKDIKSVLAILALHKMTKDGEDLKYMLYHHHKKLKNILPLQSAFSLVQHFFPDKYKKLLELAQNKDIFNVTINGLDVIKKYNLPQGDPMIKEKIDQELREKLNNIEAQSNVMTRLGQRKHRLNKLAFQYNFADRSPVKAVKLDTKIRTELNKEIGKIVAPRTKATGLYPGDTSYPKDIPLDAIFDVLDKYDIMPINDDGTPYGGFLTGRDGSGIILLAPKSSKNEQGAYYAFPNAALFLSWHKFDNTNTYETLAYIR